MIYCHAGGSATAGHGTAPRGIRYADEAGKSASAVANENRYLL